MAWPLPYRSEPAGQQGPGDVGLALPLRGGGPCVGTDAKGKVFEDQRCVGGIGPGEPPRAGERGTAIAVHCKRPPPLEVSPAPRIDKHRVQGPRRVTDPGFGRTPGLRSSLPSPPMHPPSTLMHNPMMEPAEQNTVDEAGLAAIGPVAQVVRVCEAEPAPGEPATTIAGLQRPEKSWRDRAGAPPHIQDRVVRLDRVVRGSRSVPANRSRCWGAASADGVPGWHGLCGIRTARFS